MVNYIEVAVTKLPICAIMTAMQFYLSNVDLPPMFGPVTSSKDSSLVKTVSFGMNYLF